MAPVRFGSPLAHQERSLDAVMSVWLETWWLDVTVAARQLVRRPGLAIGVVVLLAMGIGLNAGIFTVIHDVVLRALPLPDPDRLVIVTERTSHFETPTSWPDFLDLLDGNDVLASGAAFTRGSMVVFHRGGEPKNVTASSVTREYFLTLGVTPIAGRVFDPSEAERENSVALLREDFWRTAFGADAGIVGRVRPRPSRSARRSRSRCSVSAGSACRCSRPSW